MHKPSRRIKRGWMNLEILKIIEETHDSKTLLFVDAEEKNRPFDYTPGQYLTFRFDSISEKPVIRSYTMSSSPSQGNIIGVTVKEVQDGFVSKYLCWDTKVGQILRARGPIGKFCYDPKTDKKCLGLIAAGSGMTPFLSITREYAKNLGQENYPEIINLLISYRSQKDLICYKELEELSKVSNLNIFITLSREPAIEGKFLSGRIDDSHLDKVFGKHLLETTFMTCGPQDMMETIKEKLMAKQVLEKDIKTESFAT